MKEDVLFDMIKDIVSNTLRGNGIGLVDITYRKEGRLMVLRILADKKGGITIDECAKMNETIGETLDKEDFIPEKYILEVSSPGMDRPLKTKEDFLRLLGKRLRVHTYEPIEGRREFAGALEGVEGDSIAVSCGNSKSTKI